MKKLITLSLIALAITGSAFASATSTKSMNASANEHFAKSFAKAKMFHGQVLTSMKK